MKNKNQLETIQIKLAKIKTFFLRVIFILVATGLCFSNVTFAATKKTQTTKHAKATKSSVSKKTKHHSAKKPVKKSTKKSSKASKKKAKRTTNNRLRTKTYRANTARTNLDDDSQHQLIQSNFNKPSPSGFLSNVEKRLINFVHGTIDSLNYSSYKLGGKNFDTSRGVYVLDCSNYVDNVLKEVFPDAFSNLVNATGSQSPTSQHFYEFFNSLEENDGYAKQWSKIDDISSLRPGDVLVFREKKSLRSMVSGHVMVVVEKPIQHDNTYLIRVADSAPVRHSQDTRPAHTSGIGIGTLVLKENPRTGEPSAYAWQIGSYWKTNVNFAMARPIDTYS